MVELRLVSSLKFKTALGTCFLITSSNSSGPSWPRWSHSFPSSVMLAKSEPLMWIRGVKSCGKRIEGREEGAERRGRREREKERERESF